MSENAWSVCKPRRESFGLHIVVKEPRALQWNCTWKSLYARLVWPIITLYEYRVREGDKVAIIGLLVVS